jgi:hypothetical protein
MRYVFVVLFILIAIYVGLLFWSYREPAAYCRHCAREITFVAWIPNDDGTSNELWAHVKSGMTQCPPWKSPSTVAEVRK